MNEKSIKQENFNKAMALYENKNFYQNFSKIISTINIVGQILLIILLWKRNFEFHSHLISIVLAYVIADFWNGLVHMYMDNNDNYEGFFGPFVANFHLHHRTPLYKKKPVLLYGAYEEEGTNNIAELNALHQALLIARQTNSENIISIYSDSKYAIDCITTWAYSWKKNGWSKKGGEIKNLELIIEAHTLYEKLKDKIEINHVKGHAGVEGNELADRMAVYTIKAKNKDFAFYSYNKIEEVLSLTSY